MFRAAPRSLLVPLVGIAGALASGPRASAEPDAERVSLRRLGRSEYNHTVADLLGTTLRPADDFPADDSTFGFDNVTASLTVSPLQARLYELASRALVDDAFSRGRLPGCAVRAPGCVWGSLAAFAARAWRRPLAAGERAELRALHGRLLRAGNDADQAARAAFQAVLLSPRFLFRDERAGGPHALAARLSYFLWSSLPDEALLGAAAGGRLRDAAGVRAQAARMLADPKAARFVESFAGQWLSVRALEAHYVDANLFPAWDEALAAASRRETELFFGELLERRLPLAALFLADFTFVDGRLARHYGLPWPEREGAAGFRRVSVAGAPRGGILGHASVLVATSHADRTGVVKRGQWVLGQLLCDEPPPAPPGVPALPSTKQVDGSQRERLEDHRSEVRCAACHKVMDEIGFGLENYDAIGRWRTSDGKYPIDASGILPGGVKFDGPRALAAVLGRDSRFPRCFARRLFTYALGRPPAPAEQRALDRLVDRPADELVLADLILDLAASEAFRSGGAP